MKHLTWLLVLVPLLAACQKKGAELNLKEARAAIEAANSALATAFNNGDAEAVAKFYTEDAVVLPPNAEPVLGREAVQAFMRAGMDAGLSNLQLSTESVDGSGELLYEIGTYTLQVTPEGQAAGSDRGKYVVIWKQNEAGAWKLHVDIWNSSLPQAVPEMSAN